MPRIYRTPKEREKYLIRGFVKRLGYRIIRAQWQERPDAVLTLCMNGERIRVGIEQTEYFSDAPAGDPSPTGGLAEFWTFVIRSIERRTARKPELKSALVNVRFQECVGLPKDREQRVEMATRLAKELVGFVSESLPNQGNGPHPCTIRVFPDTYPMLRCILRTIRIAVTRDGHRQFARTTWTCSNIVTGHVAFQFDHVQSIVDQKARKSKTYEWGNPDERWLLITASGNTVAQSTGPSMAWSKMDSKELRNRCPKSPFDRIWFWDYADDWHLELWPGEIAG